MLPSSGQHINGRRFYGHCNFTSNNNTYSMLYKSYRYYRCNKSIHVGALKLWIAFKEQKADDIDSSPFRVVTHQREYNIMGLDNLSMAC